MAKRVKRRPPLYPELVPTAAQIRELRGERTQAQAAAIVYVSWRTWQQWESGNAHMPPGLWELAQTKGARRRPFFVPTAVSASLFADDVLVPLLRT
jgi:DNA-binding XRE family transcriptional regulator